MDFQTIVYEELTSSNDEAKRLAANGAAEGVVVRVLHQSAGRGRQNRVWSGTRGDCLMFSIILRPELKATDASVWTLVAGLGVCRALSRFVEGPVHVKWPNDIIADGRKICGILSEQSAAGEYVRHLVTGIGVNVNQDAFAAELQDKAVSMRMLTGMVPDTDAVLAAILSELDVLYARFTGEGFAALMDAYNKVCVNVGAEVQVLRARDTLLGVARGVDADGCLLVETPGGLVRVFSGEASVRLADGRYV